jgi:hypothetical protein
MTTPWVTAASICGYVACLFLGVLAAIILIFIWTGKIDLSQLIAEANGEASMSRFQLLIFTFVVAISLFAIVESKMTFPDIPSGILTLLGISASTYAVGKGISYSQPDIMLGRPTTGEDNAANAQAAADQAGAHAALAQQAATAIQAAAAQVATHAATAQQAVQQTADNAAKAQEAADQASGRR